MCPRDTDESVRRAHLPLLTLLFAILLVAPAANALQLKGFNLVTPSIPQPHGAHILYQKLVYVEYSVYRRGGYSRIAAVSSAGRVYYGGVPGGPKLPYIMLVFHVPRGMEAYVRVEPLDAVVVRLKARPEPVTGVYAYIAGRLVRVNGPIDKMYQVETPSILYTYYHVGDKLIVYVYPAQYKDGRLLEIRAFLVKVYASRPSIILAGNATNATAKPAVLVIAKTGQLARFVASLVERVHPGYRVYYIGVDNITAMNVTPLYPQRPLPGILMPTVPPLPFLKYYNVTLAAKIRGFIAYAYNKLGVRYVIIVGGARDVPPSYYYSSRFEYFLVSPYDAWIPTDYLYADLNLDFRPDVYVGRIPFSSPQLLQEYFEKVALYEERVKAPTVTVIGGYPFASLPPSAESFYSYLTYKLHAFDNLEASFMTRTLGNYTAKSFQRLLLEENEPAWTFMIVHSSGATFADRVYNATLGAIVWETLLTAQQALREARANRVVGIVSSVGCEGGAWDFDLVPPPFRPPSVGWALVAGWGSVAYIGQSRVAFEWFAIPINVTDGVVGLLLGGTSLLHAYMLMAWSKGGAKTLGEAFWNGIAGYIATPYANAFVDSPPVTLGLAMAFEAILLGDPLIPLPAPMHGKAPSFKPEGYYKLVNAAIFSPLFNGKLPVYRPGYAEYLKPETSGVATLGLAKAAGSPATLMLEAYIHVKNVKPETIHLGGKLTGYVMVAAAGPHGYLLAMTPALGVYAGVKGSKVEVKVWGADTVTMSETTPLFVYMDGRLLGVLLEPTSEFNASYPEPGVHKLVVVPQVPVRVVSLYRLLREFFTDTVTLKMSMPLSVEAGRARGVGGVVEIPVTVTLHGEPVDAKLTVEAPAGKVEVERVATGHYLVKLYGLKPGSYTVTVKAEYSSKYVTASGVAQVNVYTDALVSKAAADIAARVNATESRLSSLIAAKTGEVESVVKGEVEVAAKRITDRLASVEQSLSQQISDVKTSMQKSLENAVETLTSKFETGMENLYKSIASHVDEALRRTAESILGGVSSKIDSASNTIVKTISSKVQSLYDTLSSQLSQLNNNINAKLSKLESKVGAAVAAGEAASGLAAAALVAGGVAAALARRRG